MDLYNSKSTKHKETLMDKLRTSFFYGFIIILPMFITLWVVSFIIELMADPISAIFGEIPLYVSFLISLVIILLVGITAKNFIGQSILNFVESLMYKLPVIKTIYKAMKEIIAAFKMKDRNIKAAVLVEYPCKGVWAMGFITKDKVTGLNSVDGEDLGAGKVAVFLPTTPNPTSGYFVYVNESEIKRLSISVEDSIKVLMSAGTLSPG